LFVCGLFRGRNKVLLKKEVGGGGGGGGIPSLGTRPSEKSERGSGR